jgi:hypothetical protein
VRHLPRAADYVEQQDRLASFFHDNPQHITGCVFSSLLSARFDDLTPTVGLVPVEASQQHYERLQGLGYQAAALHCEAYTLDAELIERFRQQKASGDRRGKG